MSGSSTVDRQEMAKAAQQIDQKVNDIYKTQTTLQDQVTSLMARWKGNAATAFVRAFQDFDGQFSVVQQQLQNIHGKLVDTQTTYTRNEQEQQDATAAITAILNNPS